MIVAFVTGSRSEWRLIRPLLDAARASKTLTPRLVVTGAHLSARHGETVRLIRADGHEPDECVPILEIHDTPDAIARATGRAVLGCADALTRLAPAWTVVAGDRYESFAAGVAATMLAIPLAHIAGGETDVATNQDCNLRNALTKLAQAHFVSHELAARRVIALGEETWRVRVVGLPSLDGLATQAATFADLCSAAGLPADCLPRRHPRDATGRRFVLASFLPVTLEREKTRTHLDILLAALDEQADVHKLIVLSNADADGDALDSVIRAWAYGRSDVSLAPALSAEHYAAALRDCGCYVGNSSSGVIEAPLLGTPAVIVGTRQSGRPLTGGTRCLSSPTLDALTRAIRDQLNPAAEYPIESPYGDGRAAPRICAALSELRGDPRLMCKRLITPPADTGATIAPDMTPPGMVRDSAGAPCKRTSAHSRQSERREPFAPTTENRR